MNSIQYKKRIDNIKEYAVKNGVSSAEAEKIFKDCLGTIKSKTSSKTNILKLLKYTVGIFLIIILFTFVLYNHPKTHNVLLRNLQSFIYPGLRAFRKLAIPIITLCPSLTEWYDEWCLVENPYFQVNEMDCMPCSSVTSIQDLTGHEINSSFNAGIPFVRTEKNDKIDLKNLTHTYMKFKDVFDKDSEQVTSNQESYRTIHDVMNQPLDKHPYSSGKTHITWRINRMEPGRKLRKLFSKLSGIPDWWSPSVEKYIFIDEPKSTEYILPNPECANVILQCTNGERLIKLIPSPECTENCQELSVLLSTHQSLWYNWWYWRPKSSSSENSTEITIMYFTSYC